MRHLRFRLLPFLFLCLVPFYASAALITVNDGDSFNYNVNDTYLFTGALSSSNPVISYGVNVDPGEIMSFVVNAPVEFDLVAGVTTGSYGSGAVVINPNSFFRIYSGTSYDFLINGLDFAGQTKWLTLGVESTAISIIDEVYGGELPIDDISDYGQAVPVPEPETLALLGLGLVGIGFRRKLPFLKA